MATIGAPELREWAIVIKMRCMWGVSGSIDPLSCPQSILPKGKHVVTSNPLLQDFDLPPFSAIRPEHVEPAIDQILADNRAAVARLLETQRENPSWSGLVQALDELGARLGQDRKSTRLNSSHVKISYAVFCLKKKSSEVYIFLT